MVERVFLAASLLLTGCPCTQVGCATSFTWEADLGPDWSALSSSRIVACRNGVCVSGRLSATEPVGPYSSIELTGASDAMIRCHVRRTDTGFVLTVIWSVVGEPASDVYSAFVYSAVMPPPGVLASLPEEEVFYDETHRPNGDFCPPECRRAHRGP